MIVESKHLIPVITEDDEQELINGRDEFELFFQKPENFIKMIKIEDDDKNEIEFEDDNEFVKIKTKSIKPVTLFYEVTNNYILEQLKESIGC